MPATDPSLARFARVARAELLQLQAREVETWRAIADFRGAVEQARESVRTADQLLTRLGALLGAVAEPPAE